MGWHADTPHVIVFGNMTYFAQLLTNTDWRGGGDKE